MQRRLRITDHGDYKRLVFKRVLITFITQFNSNLQPPSAARLDKFIETCGVLVTSANVHS